MSGIAAVGGAGVPPVVPPPAYAAYTCTAIWARYNVDHERYEWGIASAVPFLSTSAGAGLPGQNVPVTALWVKTSVWTLKPTLTYTGQSGFNVWLPGPNFGRVIGTPGTAGTFVPQGQSLFLPFTADTPPVREFPEPATGYTHGAPVRKSALRRVLAKLARIR